MDCGSRLAALRERRGLTQEKLSQLLGITRASLSHYETNRRTPDFNTLSKVADYFNVSMDYLICRVNNSTQYLDPNVRQFVDHLELSDEKILQKFALTIDGKQLTPEEARQFIAFIRAERLLS